MQLYPFVYPAYFFSESLRDHQQVPNSRAAHSVRRGQELTRMGPHSAVLIKRRPPLTGVWQVGSPPHSCLSCFTAILQQACGPHLSSPWACWRSQASWPLQPTLGSRLRSRTCPALQQHVEGGREEPLRGRLNCYRRWHRRLPPSPTVGPSHAPCAGACARHLHSGAADTLAGLVKAQIGQALNASKAAAAAPAVRGGRSRCRSGSGAARPPACCTLSRACPPSPLWGPIYT